MTSTRIGSLALTNEVLRDVSLSQAKLGDLQIQISSGLKSQTFAGLNGSVEKFAQITSQLGRTKQYSDNNQFNLTKLQTVDVAIQKITDIADKIKNSIVGANGANISTANLPQVIGDLLVSFGSELNASYNGHYLFGGADSATQPVPDTTVPNTNLGTPDDNYYQGSTQDTTMRLDDYTDVTFPVRADDPAFQKIYAAARMAIDAANRNDTQEMTQAQQLIQDGQSDLIGVQSRVGTVMANVQAISDRLQALTSYWKGLSDTLSKTDVVAASTLVADNQATLQASYQVYSRLSQLRLSDYL